MKSERQLEFKVGVFIAASLAVTMLAIWLFGSAQNLFVKRDPFFITLPNASGIATGAKVTVSGVNAGVVDSLALISDDRTVRVHLSISSQFEDSLRQDSVAEILTEGVLGDKMVAISAGNTSLKKIAIGSEIPAIKESSFQTLLGKGDHLATDLSTLAKDLDKLVSRLDRQFKGDHLSSSLGKLDSILGKIDTGNGAVSGLINDPELYDDVKKLIGETNENRIVRNIVRKTIQDADEKKKSG
jgi:phospholipid/cholesterol/gamma-HCH transport system substrate-binding protein